jgi:hypothetical protein
MQLVNVRQRMLHIAKWRLLLVAGGFAALAVASTARLAYLGVAMPGGAVITEVSAAPGLTATVFRWPALRPLRCGSMPPMDGDPAVKARRNARELMQIFPDEITTISFRAVGRQVGLSATGAS